MQKRVVQACVAGRRGGKRNVANQVERVEIVAQFISDQVERQALCGEFFNGCVFALRAVPPLQKDIEGSEPALQGPAGAIMQGLPPRSFGEAY